MASALAIQAELVIAHNADQFVVVAHGSQVVVSFKNLEALERIIGQKSEKPSDKSASGGLKKLEEINSLIRALQLNVKIVVAGKTYVEFGGKSYHITIAAVFGKLGSFFKKL